MPEGISRGENAGIEFAHFRSMFTKFEEPVLELNSVSFLPYVLESTMPIIVAFTAQWCAACRQQTSMLRDLGRRYSGRIHIAKVDIGKSPRLREEFGIVRLPSYAVLALWSPTLVFGGPKSGDFWEELISLLVTKREPGP